MTFQSETGFGEYRVHYFYKIDQSNSVEEKDKVEIQMFLCYFVNP